MSSDGHSRDLDALLAARAGQAWSRASGEGDEELPPELQDRLPDLTSDDALRALLQAAESAAAGDPRWWRLAAAEQEALAYRSREVAQDLGRRLSRWCLGSRLERPRPWASEIVLARCAGRTERDRIGEDLRECCRILSHGYEELAAARRAHHPEFLRRARAWASARGRDPEAIRDLAERLLSSTDDEFAEACERARAEEGMPPGPAAPWVDLPRFLAGEVAAAGSPDPDAELVRFVVGRLGLGEALTGRLRLVLGVAPSVWPRPGVYELEPGLRVTVAWTEMGRLRGYRELLSMTGRALTTALVEDAAARAARLRDPAIAHLFGALFESLTANPAWLDVALRGTLPSAWRRRVRVHAWLRLRQLAVQVATPWAPAVAEIPALVAARAAERATRFVHPGGYSPWSDTPSSAADELIGRLAALHVEDLLASRHGRDWATPAAGRFLRELWGSSQHGRLRDLLDDLGLGEPALEPLLELRRPILA